MFTPVNVLDATLRCKLSNHPKERVVGFTFSIAELKLTYNVKFYYPKGLFKRPYIEVLYGYRTGESDAYLENTTYAEGVKNKNDLNAFAGSSMILLDLTLTNHFPQVDVDRIMNIYSKSLTKLIREYKCDSGMLLFIANL